MNRIIEDFSKHKGEMVLMDKKVYQLIGVGQDTYDYYWILYDGRKVSLHTCVGGFAVLKNKLDDKDYNELIRLAKLNFFSSYDIYGIKEGEFEYDNVMKEITNHRNKIEEDLTKPCEDSKLTNELITDLVWNFN